MKIALKVLALFLIFAVTIVSLPMVGFLPKAETKSQSQVDTYTFKFDGEDEYNFYESDYTGTDGAPSIKNNYTVDAVAKSSFSTATNPKQTSTNAAAVLGDSADSKVGVISVPVKSGDTALTGHEIGDFVSPDAAIFEKAKSEEKFLTSGSFDLCTSRKGSYTPIFVFGQNSEKSYLFRIGAANTGGLDYLYHAEYALTFDKYKAAFAKNNATLKGTSIGDESWFHYEFSYSADGKLTVTVSNGSVQNTFTSSNSIPEKDRYFALTTALCTAPNNANRPVYFDNVVLNFAPDTNKYKIVTYNFEDGNPEFVTDAYTAHKHDNCVVSYSRVANAGMWNVSGNKVVKVSKTSKNPDADSAANGNMSAFISPTKEVIDEYKNAENPRYLAGGSFDLLISGDARYNEAFVYGLDDTSYQFAILTIYKNAPVVGNYSKNLDSENTSIASQDTFQGGIITKPHTWFHYEFTFMEDNRLLLEISNANGDFARWISNIPVEPENRMFAFASPYFPNGREFMFDNVTLKFGTKDTPCSSAIDFMSQQYVMETLELNPAKIVPYDFPRINKVAAEYDAICLADPTIPEEFPKLEKEMTALKAAVAAWGDVSTAEKTAESFYNLYFKDIEAVDYTKAYNIYRRLTKAVRNSFAADYATQYTAMLSAIENSGTESGAINVIAVGDSITAGGWPNEMQTICNNTVGSGVYSVFNYGNGGKRITSTAANNDPTVRDGNYRQLITYYNSINYQSADVVTIMLGTNDISHIGFADENGNFIPERYQQFKDIYTDLLQSYMALDSNPQVIICVSPNVRVSDRNTSFTNKIKALRTLYKDIAEEYDLEIFDVYDFSTENMVQSDYRDGLHPTTAGHKKLGQYFLDSLQEYEMQDLNGAFLMSKKLNGDANGDGKCDIADLLRVRKYIANITEDVVISNVDFDKNGEIDDNDYLSLCKYLLSK